MREDNSKHSFNLTARQWRALKNLINAASTWPNDDFEGRSGRQEYTTAYTVARARRTKKAIDSACDAFGCMRDFDREIPSDPEVK